jgi:CheY-like chemotaxis protein
VKLPCLQVLTQPAIITSNPQRKSDDGLVLLVVEDNADAADTFQILLEVNGYVAHIAKDGPEALQQIKELDPDIVFMDLGLPGIDGYSIARRLQARNRQRPVLIAVSGYGQEEDKRKAREADFAEYTTKPVSWPQIESILIRYSTTSGQAITLY